MLLSHTDFSSTPSEKDEKLCRELTKLQIESKLRVG